MLTRALTGSLSGPVANVSRGGAFHSLPNYRQGRSTGLHRDLLSGYKRVACQHRNRLRTSATRNRSDERSALARGLEFNITVDASSIPADPNVDDNCAPADPFAADQTASANCGNQDLRASHLVGQVTCELMAEHYSCVEFEQHEGERLPNQRTRPDNHRSF